MLRFQYNNADQTIRAISGAGTAASLDEWSATYTPNGRMSTLADANSNLTTFVYDGFDRMREVRFPNVSGGGSSASDFERYTYDASSNVVQVRRRDGTTIVPTLDNLNRITFVDASANGQDIGYTYDNFGRLLTSSAAETLTFNYDQLSRLVSQQHSVLGTVSYAYDAAGRMSRLIWPDGFYAQYTYDAADDLLQIGENGATSGAGLLAEFQVDDLGRRVSVTRGNSVVTTFGYDAAQRLREVSHDLFGALDDETIVLDYNPAQQVISRTASNTRYQWSPLAAGATTYVVNGLNQYAAIGGASQSYDQRANRTTDGMGYDIRNNLVNAANGAAFTFDPLGRLYQTQSSTSAATRFLYDGAQVIGEFDSSGNLLRRYVYGSGITDLVTWYEGAGTSDRRWFVQDQLGSVIAVADSVGSASVINSYDEFGISGANNAGRFQFAAQMWLPEISGYHVRTRAMLTAVGRFQQPDRILYAGGRNLYAYVSNDPVNRIDPFGLDEEPIVVWGCPPDSICGETGMQAMRDWFESVFGGAWDSGQNAQAEFRDATRAAMEGVDRATQCAAFNVGGAVEGAEGFGGNLEAGARYNRGTGQLGAYLNGGPSVGDGGSAQVVVGYNDDAGGVTGSGSLTGPVGRAPSVRRTGVGSGVYVSAAPVIGRTRAGNIGVTGGQVGLGTGGGWVTSTSSQLAAVDVQVAPANTNCQQASQPGAGN